MSTVAVVTNRYAAGFTVAGFPLTAALLAITASNYWLAALCGALFLLALLLTAAPRIRLLYKLPGFGAVQMAAEFTANGAVGREVDGREEVILAVPRGSLPSTVLVVIGAHNLTNREVENVLFNVGCEVGHAMKPCDGWGMPVTKGDVLPPVEGFDRTSIPGMRMTGKELALFHFRMRIREEGRYRAFIGMSSSSFFSPLLAAFEFEVVESDSPSLRDQLTPIIDRAEAVSKGGADVFGGEDGMRRALMDIALEAHHLLLRCDSQEYISRFTNAEPDCAGLETGVGYLRASALAKAKVLYEIRNELGRRDATSSSSVRGT